MAHKQAELSDREIQNDATIIYYGQRYPESTVQRGLEKSDRRIVYPPYQFDVAYKDDYPPQVDIEWYGERYEAELSVQSLDDGSTVPVYEFFVGED